MDKSTLREFVGQAIQEEVGRLAGEATDLFSKLLEGEEDPKGFEQGFRSAILSLGTAMLGKTLERLDGTMLERIREQGHRTPAGDPCSGAVPSKGKATVKVTTVLGTFSVHRSRVRCRSCKRTLGTVDETLRTTPEHLTPAMASAAALAAAVMPYAQAEANLLELLGIHLTDNRIHRVVDRVAPSATRLLRTDPGDLETAAETLPPPYRPFYASVDGGRIRMRDGSWREPCGGIVWWEGTDGKLRRFVFAEVHDKERILCLLDRWLEHFRRHRRGRPILIADGATWIWEWATRHPGAVWVLDYYHLKEHIWKAANTIYGEKTRRAARFVAWVTKRIWRGHLFSTILKLDQRRPRGWRHRQQRKALRDLATYLENHQEMMDYRRLRRAGRTIGSGHMESTCKQLFSMRIKGPGMFWSERGAQSIMHLRALYISGRWDELWSDVHNRDYESYANIAA